MRSVPSHIESVSTGYLRWSVLKPRISLQSVDDRKLMRLVQNQTLTGLLIICDRSKGCQSCVMQQPSDPITLSDHHFPSGTALPLETTFLTNLSYDRPVGIVSFSRAFPVCLARL